MNPEDRKVTFPIMGRNQTRAVTGLLENLGLEVIPAQPITDNTIKRGAKLSPSMMCIPYKVTLGNYMDSLDAGANTLLAYDGGGNCRFRQYHHLHEHALRGEGYDFEMVTVHNNDFLRKMAYVSGKPLPKVVFEAVRAWRGLQKSDEQRWSEDKPNIGIIGEVFCASDETTNMKLEVKIRDLGANPFNVSTTANYVGDHIGFLAPFRWAKSLKGNHDKRYHKMAEGKLDGFRAGHAFENLVEMYKMTDRGADGLVHVLPLCCMPESTIEPYIDSHCKETGTPLLRIAIDENSAEANFETRLETFLELIKIKRENGR